MTLPARNRAVAPDPPFMPPIYDDLQRVERLLCDELASAVETVFAVSRHMLEAGGKRLRPSLVLLSARACSDDVDVDRLTSVAASTEMIHMATLLHDDVIDAADSRRGRMTVNSLWSNQISVLTGDYSLAKAFSLFTKDGDIHVMRALSHAMVAMTEGEMMQIESRGSTCALVDSYLSIIEGKTAEFMSSCCRIGAIIADAPASLEEALAGYGLRLGMAFQIIDDLLDFIGDPAHTGKPVGGDIREGKMTMPVILAMEKAGPDDRARLEAIVHGDEVNAADIEFMQRLAIETCAVEGTRQIAARYVSQAIDELLATLPPSDARKALQDCAHFILTRDR
jgi:octaprenyl-diphosphate synthase